MAAEIGDDVIFRGRDIPRSIEMLQSCFILKNLLQSVIGFDTIAK